MPRTRRVLPALALLCCTRASALPSLGPLRLDGVPVVKPPAGSLLAEYERIVRDGYPWRDFSQAYVQAAKADPKNWITGGLVTPVKDQGPHGYCGTFGRVGAAEGQFAMRGGGALTSFSEEELVDCIGWDRDQFSYFAPHGFMPTKDYPYNTSSYPDSDPPVPGNPCRYDAQKVVPRTAGGAFTSSTGGAPNEDQLIAFVHHNGPVQTGIASDVFGLREQGCDAKGTCFITKAMCQSVAGKPIDHSILLVGYGTDPTNGDYWIVKNSWSTAFANGGFIKVARGVDCGRIACCGNTYTYGDPAAYYEASNTTEDTGDETIVV